MHAKAFLENWYLLQTMQTHPEAQHASTTTACSEDYMSESADEDTVSF